MHSSPLRAGIWRKGSWSTCWKATPVMSVTHTSALAPRPCVCSHLVSLGGPSPVPPAHESRPRAHTWQDVRQRGGHMRQVRWHSGCVGAAGPGGGPQCRWPPLCVWERRQNRARVVLCAVCVCVCLLCSQVVLPRQKCPGGAHSFGLSERAVAESPPKWLRTLLLVLEKCSTGADLRETAT